MTKSLVGETLVFELIFFKQYIGLKQHVQLIFLFVQMIYLFSLKY